MVRESPSAKDKWLCRQACCLAWLPHNMGSLLSCCRMGISRLSPHISTEAITPGRECTAISPQSPLLEVPIPILLSLIPTPKSFVFQQKLLPSPR